MHDMSDTIGHPFHSAWAELPPRQAARAVALLERLRGREVDGAAWQRASELWLAQGGERGWMGLEAAKGVVLALFRFEVLCDPRARLLQASDLLCAEIAGLTVTARESLRAIRELARVRRCALVRLCHDDEGLEPLARELGFAPFGDVWAAAAAGTTGSVVVPFPGPRA